MKTQYALVGAPNCGKTVLFNGLTGANAKVANYVGVTVDKRTGQLIGHHDIEIVDLPGIYSLRAASHDEAVTRDVVLGKLGRHPDALIAVADATNLRMTLRLVLELKTLGLPLLVSLNMADVAQSRGLKIDVDKLAEKLGVPVLLTAAVRPDDVQAMRDAIVKLPRHDENVVTVNQTDLLERKLSHLDTEKLYAEVDEILQAALIQAMQLPSWHKKLDTLALHPMVGLPILLVILLLVFQAVYAWAEPVMTLIEDTFAWLGEWVTSILPEGILADLLVNGVIAGVGGVLVFLPQIMILFAFLLLLEDSGYLPRAAFMLDNLLAKTGLSGRSFIPLLSSFACAVPAVMAARTINDPSERLVTIVIAPMLTCSARLPVYALIIAAIIPEKTVFGIFNLQGLTLFVLYFAGIVSAAAVAFIMKLWAKRDGNIQQFPLLMELPTYRMPNFRHILRSLWERVSAFLKRAGTIIFALSVILWALTTFPAAPEGATGAAIDYSFAGMLGKWIQPIFAPLGFTWEMCIAMIPGMAAREVVVAALGTVYAVGADSEEAVQNALMPIVVQDWGLPTAFAFLAWYVYAPMCLATLATIRREVNSLKKTWLITIYLFVLAYFFAFLIYHMTKGLM
ncbi:ferrous iron transporter B [Wielerella bovis]|uniref:ferrous iron transporter B n=1 Tax=Wielerella bovis TaxID=2917790 RepID=UPI0020195C09|nr:ferrous iron transporter B [Wielerella bovis]MCG7656327.1 ferrous iron transporter B [Wielerella bovis]MCG7658552.1 ferrous iron transporter B [Wielerella bovis]